MRVQAAFTEPQLALMRVTVERSSTGTVSLHLEGSFSLADAVQLDFPLGILVQQGALTARFDLAGNVFTSVGGGPEQSAPGPGVVGVAARAIVLVLPPGFSTGSATAQVVGTYDDHALASNRLGFGL